MKRHLNVLYVTLDGAHLRKDGAAIVVRHDGSTKLRIPLLNLEAVTCFGWNITVSAAAMAACSEAGVSLSFLSPTGRLLAVSHGFTGGNILLRRAQYRAADDPRLSLAVSSSIVAAKIANGRALLMRSARDHEDEPAGRTKALREASRRMKACVRGVLDASSIDEVRGIEGQAARIYFAQFNQLILSAEHQLRMHGRTRRPPTDPVNALLSFSYSLLTGDCRCALESCGLDPQCGYLHSDRPGRPGLALDLVEEFRSSLADRFAIALLNRSQIRARDFETRASGAVMLKEQARISIIRAWQERKSEILTHPYLGDPTTIGMLPHIQARLLARFLRGDLSEYPAYIARQ
jgi:CRISPR-associated protein Cas1